MSFYTVVLLLLIIATVVLYMLKDHPVLGKYWGFAVVLIPGILAILSDRVNRYKDKKDNRDLESRASSLKDRTSSIKESLQEVKTVSTIKIALAKNKNAEDLKRLEDVLSIDDEAERRKRLARMMDSL